jgi:hypothetical protein
VRCLCFPSLVAASSDSTVGAFVVGPVLARFRTTIIPLPLMAIQAMRPPVPARIQAVVAADELRIYSIAVQQH